MADAKPAAVFRAAPFILAERIGLPPGNAIVGARMLPDGNIEFAIEGVDAPPPVNGVPTVLDFVIGRTADGAETTWFEPRP